MVQLSDQVVRSARRALIGVLVFIAVLAPLSALYGTVGSPVKIGSPSRASPVNPFSSKLSSVIAPGSGGSGLQHAAVSATGASGRQLMQAEEPGCTSEVSESLESFRVLLLLSLLFVCLLVAFTLRRFKSKYLHESAASILLGVIVGCAVRFFSDETRLQSLATFNQQFFFIYLLPPIIFESGYNMNKRVFFRNIYSVLLFALLGTIVSALVFGFGLWAVGLLGVYNEDLSVVECLIFGALISATDPVTVLAIFKELHVDSNLFANVFGESVLNDAIAIVLYRTFFMFLIEEITVMTILLGLVNFWVIFLGSLFVGTLTGLLSAMLFRYTNLYLNPTLEFAMFILYAFSSYLFAEGLNLSGIVSILFCGMTMAHYVKDSLSEETKFLSVHFFETAATMSETFVFCYLGISILNVIGDFDIVLIVFSLIFLAISRAVHIYPLSLVVNLLGVQSRIPFNHQMMMWLSGLRGAIAFALAIDLSTQTSHGPVILTTTLFIVLCTVVSLGGSTNLNLSLLKIKTNDTISEEDTEHSKGVISKWFLDFDKRVMRPLFTRIPTKDNSTSPSEVVDHHSPKIEYIEHVEAEIS